MLLIYTSRPKRKRLHNNIFLSTLYLRKPLENVKLHLSSCTNELHNRANRLLICEKRPESVARQMDLVLTSKKLQQVITLNGRRVISHHRCYSAPISTTVQNGSWTTWGGQLMLIQSGCHSFTPPTHPQRSGAAEAKTARLSPRRFAPHTDGSQRSDSQWQVSGGVETQLSPFDCLNSCEV